MTEKLELINVFSEEIKQELMTTFKYIPVQKDIIIVVRDQLEYLQICVNSIRANTENYQIFVWDNASGEETQEWLKEQKDIVTVRNEENIGFIIPNNELIKLGNSPYIVLLNSDTKMLPDWDKSLIAHLQQDDQLGQVGFMGGILDETGKGKWFQFGTEIDYITGWCFAIKRDTYEKFGLFDQENLEFAYGEDADFSLRLQDNNLTIRALHLGLVHHFENKTILQVRHERDCEASFKKNHRIIAERWKRLIGRKLFNNKALQPNPP